MAALKRSSFIFLSVVIALTISGPLVAQESPATISVSETEVPRVRTFPGTESRAFPYARPDEVGLSSEKLVQLGNEIVEWVANGDLSGRSC